MKSKSTQFKIFQNQIQDNELNFIMNSFKYGGVKGSQIIQEFLKQTDFLTKVYLKIDYGCNVTSKGMQQLSEGLKSLSDLHHLILIIEERNMIQEQGAQYLSEAFQYLTKLRTLRIDVNLFNQIGDVGISHIGNNLSFLPDLQILELNFSGDNKITKIGCLDLSRGLKCLQNLQDLNLSINPNNEIKQEGAASLGSAISELSKLTNLSLSIGDLNEDGHNLTVIFLNNINKEMHIKNLKLYLDCKECEENDDDKIKYQRGNLFSNLREITSLTLRFIKIIHSNNALQQFMCSLEEIINLEEFSIYCNDKKNIYYGLEFQIGYQYIGQKLRYQLNLIKLDITLENWKQNIEDIQDLSVGLQQLTKLKFFSFRIGLSYINQQHIQLIIESLKRASKLEAIYIFIGWQSLNINQQLFLNEEQMVCFKGLKYLKLANVNSEKLDITTFNFLARKLIKAVILY